LAASMRSTIPLSRVRGTPRWCSGGRCAGTDTGGHLGRASGRVGSRELGCRHHALRGRQGRREWIGADNLGLFVKLGVLDDPRPTQAGHNDNAGTGHTGSSIPTEG
jgi:hypothetical protein